MADDRAGAETARAQKIISLHRLPCSHLAPPVDLAQKAVIL